VDLKTTRYEIGDAGVATVWLHRPARANAYTARMALEYRWIFEQLEAEPRVRVAIVTGSGKAFSVGADASGLEASVERGTYETELPAGSPVPGHGVHPQFDHDLAWHWGLRFPVIAAINGAIAGVSLVLACFCDFRFAAAEAKLTTAAPKLGLPAEIGLSWVLPRLVGLTAAADLLLSGRTIACKEAPPGLFTAVYPGAELMDRVHEYAHWMATAVGPEAVAQTKRQLYADQVRFDVGDSVEESKQLINIAMGGKEFAEGVAAFTQRRPPRF
jgi:enoyl-CoA hydratase/carnithine racemase